jgi:hypothetical protein
MLDGIIILILYQAYEESFLKLFPNSWVAQLSSLKLGFDQSRVSPNLNLLSLGKEIDCVSTAW